MILKQIVYSNIITIYYSNQLVCLFLCLATFPIDTSKTRLQLQGQHIDSRQTELRYRGMSHAVLRISKEEGFCALYNG